MEQNTVEFTAVLADDEYSVLEGVKTAIDWESLGIRIAALASNGHEALDAIIKISRIWPLSTSGCQTLQGSRSLSAAAMRESLPILSY